MTTESRTPISFSVGIIAIAAALLLLSGCGSPKQRPKPHVSGKIVGNFYTSPRGGFTVPIPVSREVGGGVVHDDAQSVLFRDNWGSKIGFYSRPIEPKVVEQAGVQKTLEFLAKDLYGDSVAFHFHPDILGGTLSFVSLKPVGPRTGIATFIRENRVFLVETDLLPGVELLSKDDDGAREKRDVWLENRAIELLRTMEIK